MENESQLDMTAIHRLGVTLSLLILEIVVVILSNAVSSRLHCELRQKRLITMHRRKLNSVADQLTILRPAFSSNDIGSTVKQDEETEKGPFTIKMDEESDKIEIADEKPIEKVTKKPRRSKKSKNPKEFQEVQKFIENEKFADEKPFEKILNKPKIVIEDYLPPPPEGF